MQFTIPIDRTWDKEQVLNNLKALRSEIKWKNFEINYNEDMCHNKGYFVINIRRKGGKDNSSIILWGNRVQINSNNPLDFELCFVFLSMLLRENDENIFLETLMKKLDSDGELPKEFQKASIETIMSFYIALVNGKIQEEMVAELTKRWVRKALLFMVDSLDKIGNEK